MDLHALVADVIRELDREEAGRRLAEAQRRDEEARRFLRELDPDSQEGLWFEAVAESFPSRLAAARAYVVTVRAR